MILHQAILAAQNVFRAVLQQARRPVVLWSGGKDSMVLLHLARTLQPRWPVIWLRDPDARDRYQFGERIAREWNLAVHSWPAESVALAKANGALSLIMRYGLGGGHHMSMPVDCIEAPGMVCGVQDVVARPKCQPTYLPWDWLLHGAKSSDTDQLHGALTLACDVAQHLAAPNFAYPLRHWTDDLIWEYTEKFDVPYQTDRYEKVDGAWRERADKTGNPDWLPCCTRCLDPDGPAAVACPRLGCQVNNISAQIPRQDSILPAYMRKE